jgi:hypothetical protein
MYLIAMKDSDEKGAFSVINEKGEKVIYLFQEHDDVSRFAMQLEDGGYPKTEILEYEDKQILVTCELTNTKYTIITPEDIVVPPVLDNDIQSDNRQLP